MSKGYKGFKGSGYNKANVSRGDMVAARKAIDAYFMSQAKVDKMSMSSDMEYGR